MIRIIDSLYHLRSDKGVSALCLLCALAHYAHALRVLLLGVVVCAFFSDHRVLVRVMLGGVFKHSSTFACASSTNVSTTLLATGSNCGTISSRDSCNEFFSRVPASRMLAQTRLVQLLVTRDAPDGHFVVDVASETSTVEEALRCIVDCIFVCLQFRLPLHRCRLHHQ